MSTPLFDIEAEALRVLHASDAAGVPVRLVGGLAIHLHAHGDLHPAFRREYRDIDLVTRAQDGREVGRLLTELGYAADTRFNAAHGRLRMLFFDEANDRQLDVFVGDFTMCHQLPIADRLELDAQTVPLAELLLTKLQIVEMNAKDQRDILALLHHHEVGDGDRDTINAAFIGDLCGTDWGLWRTVTMNLDRTLSVVADSGLALGERAAVSARVAQLSAAIDDAPKSRRWRMRARVGDRVQWYEEPEDHLA